MYLLRHGLMDRITESEKCSKQILTRYKQPFRAVLNKSLLNRINTTVTTLRPVYLVMCTGYTGVGGHVSV